MSLALPTALPPQRPFLGIERSAAGRLWRERLDVRAAQASLAIVQRHGVPEILARVLAGRGVAIKDVPGYLDPRWEGLMPDPDTLTGMAAAVARLADAAERGEQVAVFGDYDVDGATSTALMVEMLRAAGLDPLFHIPDRIFEGYGPNIPAIEALAQRGVRLLVTVDCGTLSFEPFAHTRALGMEVVVVDHHQAAETLPEVAALVNPNRADDVSGLGHLCAAGLVLMVLVGLRRELRRRGWWNDARPEPNLGRYLDLVALGTVADVVPLIGLNRAFVTRGLAMLRRRERPGLTALMDVARLSGPPKCWHLGFLLGPRINAGGRIGDATLGTRLLLTQDPIEAGAIAAELDRLNTERQVVEKQILAEAEAEAEAALGIDGEGASVILASGQGWHPGVVGLVAARLKERFSRPAFAVAFNGDLGAGSARSIPGVDVGRAVRGAVEAGLLVKGGGHAMAAGLTVARDKLGAFRAYLEEALAETVEDARAVDELAIDGGLSAGAATPELVELIERAGPYGAGNPQPVFAFPAHRLVHVESFSAGHVRVRLKAPDGSMLSGVAFRAATAPLGEALLANRGQLMHVAGTLDIDSWQGRSQVSLRVSDAAVVDRP
ncbi:single-stranded-DNA-specific exonuclease RecJ [Ancylobacter sp. 6x-1]|uniref:Single-stranded-DNA-specific exonuclease RecJ n=1 Tax=Ancylobacter crimeensis TaxID=2579147 RepID=A0ABT0D6E0_9HYPH|nr:single-stranded-DNA-specific exonuclease RecJ [Ancylobacter crimeensis]MCK0195515.1 single-stranded-DNA-specific exonuclease RecJ [Ancylobacter crimeensis]